MDGSIVYFVIDVTLGITSRLLLMRWEPHRVASHSSHLRHATNIRSEVVTIQSTWQDDWDATLNRVWMG
jgi:hypothetical protein